MAELADRKRPHADDETPRKSKRAKEAKKLHDVDDEVDAEVVDDDGADNKTSKKSKKDKKDKKENKDKKEQKEKKDRSEKKSKKDKTKTSPSQPQDDNDDEPYPPADVVFPFYTQTVSLWVPLFPLGFDKPITSAATQHLDGLVNHYAPHLGGFLLAYRNVNLADKAKRASPNNPSTDATPATLTSVDEYAVGFGWMTADVDLFVPSRGAWLEGSMILQNEGSIGVSCWDKFNASIEAARLPKGWQYIEIGDVEDVEAQPAQTGANGEAMDMEEDYTAAVPATDTESVAPLQATGYWTDADGRPVEGKIRFRIKDFDVGLAGDNGYLAIEGTMLREDEERALRAKERARYSRKRDTHGIHGHKVRRLPEFSITRFGKEDEEEESGRRVELYKGSRPGTPDD
ncbi:hypothetical protein SEUCBS139899_009265 [Sporothrix eucalyptigena]